MSSFTKKERVVILILVVIVIVIGSINIFKKNLLSQDNYGYNQNLVENSDTPTEQDIDTSEGTTTIMVHISGQVYKPGLVELESGSRVVDAVNKAGGLKEDADLDRINLAKKLADEEKIYVPKVGENTDNVSDISIAEGSSIGGNTDGKIDINNATKEELISLPGIGEVIAGRIIDYRKNNRFKTIEDIKNVSGIGSKKYEGIKDLIKVN